MFTGIIQEIGTMVRRESAEGVVRLTIHAPKTAARVERLESVAVSGVCLSVVRVRGETMVFEVIRETQRLTTIGTLRRGDRVNLEPSLAVSDRLSGHIVFGHVDGRGVIIARRPIQGEVALTIRTSAALRRYLVPKGPVALDGVSLTVGQRTTAATFTVHLIPETLRQTTLGEKTIGERVNIELDYLAKLIWHFSHLRRQANRGA